MGSSLFDAVKGRGFFAPSREQGLVSSLSPLATEKRNRLYTTKSDRGARLFLTKSKGGDSLLLFAKSFTEGDGRRFFL
jgi:hypothetical protein